MKLESKSVCVFFCAEVGTKSISVGKIGVFCGKRILGSQEVSDKIFDCCVVEDECSDGELMSNNFWACAFTVSS